MEDVGDGGDEELGDRDRRDRFNDEVAGRDVELIGLGELKLFFGGENGLARLEPDPDAK